MHDSSSSTLPTAFVKFCERRVLIELIDFHEHLLATLRDMKPGPERYDIDIERVCAPLRERIAAEKAEVKRIDGVTFKAEGRAA